MIYTLTLMKLRQWLLVLALVPGVPAWSQKPMAVLDWWAPTTLTTYLLQQLHAQYVPRAAELATAVQSAAGTRVHQDSVRARFRWVLGPLPTRTPLGAQVVGVVEGPGLRTEKIVYESSPRHHVTANLYVPAGAAAYAAFLCRTAGPAYYQRPVFIGAARRAAHLRPTRFTADFGSSAVAGKWPVAVLRLFCRA